MINFYYHYKRGKNERREFNIDRTNQYIGKRKNELDAMVSTQKQIVLMKNRCG